MKSGHHHLCQDGWRDHVMGGASLGTTATLNVGHPGPCLNLVCSGFTPTSQNNDSNLVYGGGKARATVPLKVCIVSVIQISRGKTPPPDLLTNGSCGLTTVCVGGVPSLRSCLLEHEDL